MTSRSKPKTEIFHPPQEAYNLAVRRCAEFPIAAVHLSRVGHNFLDVLMVSCYLQGIEDCATAIWSASRTEGTYETER